ncbi:hypothetical protein AUR64_00525 [Haloprofundus marisrubri]|uniref:Uncharacterized protein n=1 Tax=Haloprofundus marisrubri TaxID=1514971 RepID=A0A0W1R3Z1_9EURY|nr:hypothetical protein [Haloprofundus marisrubri]KTG08097.1 hypothetical protein AUR64_00525 [Haloprofundus marisrubri]
MVRSLWEVFLALVGRADDEDDAENARFVPSPLDLSVRTAHGGRDDEVVRELSKIDEQARELEDHRRDR